MKTKVIIGFRVKEVRILGRLRQKIAFLVESLIISKETGKTLKVLNEAWMGTRDTYNIVFDNAEWDIPETEYLLDGMFEEIENGMP